MKKPIVKKSNALINASYTISLAEQRLILLAIVSANGELEKMEELTVRAQDYAEQWGVSLSTAYESLRDAAEQLFERRFTFQQETDKGLKTTVSRWVSHVAYIEGAASVSLAFAPHVQPLLFDLKEKFTHYALEKVSRLTSVYAVRLYELLIAWRSIGRTPLIEVGDLRLRLGVEPEEYPRMTDFKRRVLDFAIKQISEHTDIVASYDQHKRGRPITGFSFSFKHKTAPMRDPDTVDMLTGRADVEGPAVAPALTPKQRDFFSSKLSEIGAIQSFAKIGQSAPDFITWLSVELGKPERVIQWMPYLVKAGFKANQAYTAQQTHKGVMA